MNYLGQVYFIGLRIQKLFILSLIRIYQKTLSPDHGWLSRFNPGGYCRFYPTCSQYTHQAVDELGIIRGLLLGGYRIFRCNPFSKGGYDPVPKR